MLTTEALVSQIKEKEKAPAGMPGGGGMGGMYCEGPGASRGLFFSVRPRRNLRLFRLRGRP